MQVTYVAEYRGQAVTTSYRVVHTIRLWDEALRVAT